VHRCSDSRSGLYLRGPQCFDVAFYFDGKTALAGCVLRATTKKRSSTFLRKKVHPGDLAGGFSDLEMIWLYYCAGVATGLKLARVFVDLTDSGTVSEHRTGNRKSSVSELGSCPWNNEGQYVMQCNVLCEFIQRRAHNCTIHVPLTHRTH